MAEERQWAGTTYGNGRMHRWLIQLLRVMDCRLLYVFSYVFVVPVCLVLNPSRHTAFSYFRQRLCYGRCRAAWATYVNHCRFAEVVIDKFAMYAGKKFDVVVDGLDRFNALAARDEGFLHLSSHVGNYEIAGYSLVSERKKIHAVVYAGEKASVMQNRNSMFSKTNISMILMQPDMSHLFEIDNALVNGDVVSFPTDRNNGSARSVTCEFLGAKARFPQGPFSVATMRGVDALAVNVMKEGWSRYHIYVTPLPYDKEAPRKEQLRQLSAGYIAELEKRVRQYPTQWYNFYEFWEQG